MSGSKTPLINIPQALPIAREGKCARPVELILTDSRLALQAPKGGQIFLLFFFKKKEKGRTGREDMMTRREKQHFFFFYFLSFRGGLEGESPTSSHKKLKQRRLVNRARQIRSPRALNTSSSGSFLSSETATPPPSSSAVKAAAKKHPPRPSFSASAPPLPQTPSPGMLNIGRFEFNSAALLLRSQTVGAVALIPELQAIDAAGPGEPQAVCPPLIFKWECAYRERGGGETGTGGGGASNRRHGLGAYLVTAP